MLASLSWVKLGSGDPATVVSRIWVNASSTELSNASITELSNASSTELSNASSTELSNASITELSKARIRRPRDGCEQDTRVRTVACKGTQFTCFTSTTVQILTPEELRAKASYPLLVQQLY
jgi:hypothetical protein